MDDETAKGLARLVAPSSKAAARSRKTGLKSKLCFCGPEDTFDTPVGVQLEIASRAGEWRRVEVGGSVTAIMVENLPKRWAKGGDFWDSRESGVRIK